jgi:hypothetical protein
LLGEEIDSMATLAFVHGWECPQERIDRGIQLRKEIKALETDLQLTPMFKREDGDREGDK